jgi:hypothetical protein
MAISCMKCGQSIDPFAAVKDGCLGLFVDGSIRRVCCPSRVAEASEWQRRVVACRNYLIVSVGKLTLEELARDWAVN